MKARRRILLLVVSLSLALSSAVVSPAQAMEAIRDTEAYKQFSKKPQDDFAKMIFLMNYYKAAPFTIVFDGSDYSPAFAFPIAQVYLFTHYKNEKAASWIKQHCYRSAFSQNIIYLRFPDGKYEPARDVILSDLKLLEKALKEDQKSKPSR
jgi:hypothetical protein